MAATRGRTITTFGGLFTPVGLDGGASVVAATGPGERRLHQVAARSTHKPDRAPHRAADTRKHKVKD